MKYTRLGRTGLEVYRIGLGCISYEDAARGRVSWILHEDAGQPFFHPALDRIDFFDNANVY